MKNNNGFIGTGLVIGIIVLLAVVGGVYYLGTKDNSVPNDNVLLENQNEIVNTKTDLKEYRNDDIGISFTYPKNYGEINSNFT
ncbi:MAG: hypothetical protein WDK96_03715 [Candidatus Paceibacterota bacterium]|jgi:hypothetical protein